MSFVPLMRSSRRRATLGALPWTSSTSGPTWNPLGNSATRPPTHAILAFKQALVEFHAEGGMDARKARYRATGPKPAREMQKMGFEFYVPEACRSYCICTFKTPEHPKFHFQTFYNLLAEQGFVIYPGKLSKGNSFRIGIIGRLFPKDCELLCLSVRKACEALQVPLPLR
ncbi:unnamed protein product [Durusdinium trenchii]|uniref:Uncharacterized protein n=1 Tax=Durusdinium trenchii TaxID=1381693 RepID=A0ABP0P8J8_9DINO